MNKRNIKIAILLFLLPLSLFGQRKPDDDYLRGMAYYSGEKYDSSIVYLTRSLAKDDGNTEARYYRALSYLKAGNGEMALKDFEEVNQAEKGRGAIWIARIYARRGDLEGTLRYLDQHLNSRYRLPESTILLDKDLSVFETNKKWIGFWKNSSYYTKFDNIMAEADYLIKTGDYVEAADILSEGLKANYRKAPLYSKRAEVYLLTGNERQALEDLSAAIGSDRRNADLYARRARLYYQSGKFRNALEDYEAALRSEPDNFRLYPEMALAKSKNGLYDEAVSDMELYLKYFTSDHRNWYNLGMIHKENDKLFKALKCFNKALTISQAEPDYFLARGETYMGTRTYKYARNDFSMALDLDPANAQAYYELGLAAVKLGNTDEACYGFNKAYEHGLFEAKEYMEKYCK